MKHVPLSVLESKIVRPGFDKHLRPLVMYRGNMTLGHAHRLWNLIVSAMEHEATLSDMTQRLVGNPERSQLCGPTKSVAATTIRGFCGRLLDNPKVMGEMPHLQEYVEWMLPNYKGGFRLERVSETTHRRRNMGAGGWRYFKTKETRKAGGNIKAGSQLLVYPFLIHDGGKPEHVLLRKVNDAVSKALPPFMRADACQDLIVGILAGEFDADNLTLPAKEMTTRIRAFCQNKGEVSLYEDVPNTDGNLRWVDVFSEEDSLWAKI